MIHRFDEKIGVNFQMVLERAHSLHNLLNVKTQIYWIVTCFVCVCQFVWALGLNYCSLVVCCCKIAPVVTLRNKTKSLDQIQTVNITRINTPIDTTLQQSVKFLWFYHCNKYILKTQYTACMYIIAWVKISLIKRMSRAN